MIPVFWLQNPKNNIQQKRETIDSEQTWVSSCYGQRRLTDEILTRNIVLGVSYLVILLIDLSSPAVEAISKLRHKKEMKSVVSIAGQKVEQGRRDSICYTEFDHTNEVPNPEVN